MGLYPDQPTPLEKEVIKRIFEPGNLVFGTYIPNKDYWRSLVSKGIMPAKNIGVETQSFSPNSVSFAMLSKWEPPRNYFGAVHKGPKDAREYIVNSSLIEAAIIIAKNKILLAFPGQIRAVGENFLDPNNHRHAYDFEERRDNTVYVNGVPVDLYNDYETWADEIRWIPEEKELKKMKLGIIPIYWEGIVIANQNNKDKLIEWSNGKLPPDKTIITVEELKSFNP